MQHGIDDEGLRALVLVVQHAVRAHALNAGEANRVHGCVLSFRLVVGDHPQSASPTALRLREEG